MQQDIWKFAISLSIALLFGLSTGYLLECLLVTALAIIAWQVFRMNALYKWVLDSKKNPMQDSGGQVYLIHREIHRQNIKSRRRKEQMSSLLKEFRKAISALPDAIILIDESGKIEWANSNSKDLLGVRYPEDSEVRFTDLIRLPEVDKLLAGKNPSSQGVEVNPLLDKGKTINIKCVRYTNSLRMIVARDVSRLIKVNQMHTDFVSNVSHELKTPLTVLRGYLEIIDDSDLLPAKLIEPIHQMNLQSIRMQFIVNDLLYLAKLEDTANVAPHEIIDVSHLLSAMIESMQPLIEEKEHSIEKSIDPDLKIKGSQAELYSAFSNLLTNAIHYTPEQGLIRIVWRNDENNATFTVSDNGLGIAGHHLDRLTQRFYRVDTDRSREGGGTGLGLAIVKHVLQRHGGRLKIDSVEGKGSEFSCLFPAKVLQGLEKG